MKHVGANSFDYSAPNKLNLIPPPPNRTCFARTRHRWRPARKKWLFANSVEKKKSGVGWPPKTMRTCLQYSYVEGHALVWMISMVFVWSVTHSLNVKMYKLLALLENSLLLGPFPIKFSLLSVAVSSSVFVEEKSLPFRSCQFFYLCRRKVSSLSVAVSSSIFVEEKSLPFRSCQFFCLCRRKVSSLP